MNLPDGQIKTYIESMLRDFQHINSPARRASLVSLRTYAVGLIRVIDFCLSRQNASLNIDALQENELEISRSFQAQKPEITALNGFICELQSCGKSLKGMRKGSKFCSKQCNNLSRANTKSEK